MTRHSHALRYKFSQAQHTIQHQLSTPQQRTRALLDSCAASLPTSKDVAHLSALFLLCHKWRRLLYARMDSNGIVNKDERSVVGFDQPHSRNDNDEDKNDDDDDDDDDRDSDLPPYDEVEQSPPPHSPYANATMTTSSRQQQRELLWKSFLYKACNRLELFVVNVLPVAIPSSNSKLESQQSTGNSRATNDERINLNDEKERMKDDEIKHLPTPSIPPLDVCIAWAALVGHSDLCLETAHAIGEQNLNDLLGWAFPLESIVSIYDTTTCQLRKDVPDLSSVQSSWRARTGTDFCSYLRLEAQDRSWPAPTLQNSLLVACPRSNCHFSAPINILPAGLDAPSSTLRRSERSLVQSGWRRGCRSCRSITVEIDSLVGAQLAGDFERWCEEPDFVFDGLQNDFSTGIPLPLSYSHALAAHLLVPLFGPVLSSSRRAANDRHIHTAKALNESSSGRFPPLPDIRSTSFNISPKTQTEKDYDHTSVFRTDSIEKGKVRNRAAPAASNALSSAVHAAALETISTTPRKLAASCDYSASRIASRVESDVLLSQPKVHQSRQLNALGMRKAVAQYPQTPQTLGGGIGPGGPTFELHNPFEEREGMSAAMAENEEESLKNLVSALLLPYQKRRSSGIVSARLSLGSSVDEEKANNRHGQTSTDSNNRVLVSIVKPVKEMLILAGQLEDWAKVHNQRELQAQVGQSPFPTSKSKEVERRPAENAPTSFSQQSVTDYCDKVRDICINEGENLRENVGGGSKRTRLSWLSNEERKRIEQRLRQGGVGVELGWAVHVLGSGRRQYIKDMNKLMGVIPRHSWCRALPSGGDPMALSVEDGDGKPFGRLKSWMIRKSSSSDS